MNILKHEPGWVLRGLMDGLVVVLLLAGQAGAAIYVTTTGTDSAGAAWATPTSLTNALAIATAGSEIWIEQGSYSNTATFTVGANCKLYGGFTNGMGSLADRNWVAFPTVLDGSKQNLTVVTVAGTDTTLDGLTIRNSYGKNAYGITKAGAGSLTLANCRIADHQCVDSSGAATYRPGLGGKFTAGTVFMTNCVVAGNSFSGATIYGGKGYGVYAAGANLQLVDCLFTNNYGAGFDTRTAKGVGLFFENGTLNVQRTHFVDNASGANNTGGGGAVYLGDSATMAATFSNCIFRHNVAVSMGTGYEAALGFGGAMWVNLNASRTVTVANCTFKDNLNDNGDGGAIYVSGGTLILKDSILWTNSVHAGRIGREIYRASGTVKIDNCSLGGLGSAWIYGVTPASMSSVMTNNPLYASGTDLHLQSPAGRWDPAAGTFVTTDTAYSPCIDAGFPASDYANEPAHNGSRVNLGAYGNTAQASKSPNAAPDLADLGVGLEYTKATFSGELVNVSAVIAEVGLCYGTNSVAGDTTNGWQTVSLVYPPQQMGSLFSLASPYPYLLTNTTYYYRWYATNAYGSSWTGVSNFTTGAEYPQGWGLGGGSNVIHVKKDATGVANGLDWANAFTTLMDGYSAVNGARSNIWMARGTFAEGSEVTVGTSLSIVGGFAGTETSLSERSTNALGVVTNYTVINGEGTHTCIGITAGNTWMDALVISNGIQRALNKAGSGVLTMSNCRLVNNKCSTANRKGVGGDFGAGSVLMTNCLVAGNQTLEYGLLGIGIYSAGVNLQVVDCLFTNNGVKDAVSGRQSIGAGLYFDNGILAVTRTDFIKNISSDHNGGAGAVYLGNGATMSATFNNCVFLGNRAGKKSEYPSGYDGFGGAMWANLSSLSKTVTLENCTFKDNHNDQGNGGAVYLSLGTLVLKNSIFSTNSVGAGFTGSEIYRANGNVLIRYSCLAGLAAPSLFGVLPANMTSVMTNNPLYASDTDLHLQSPAGRWDPAAGTFVTTDTAYSPCIDVGDPASGSSNEPTPNGNRVNLGAYGNTLQASKSMTNAPVVVNRGVAGGFDYTKVVFSGELTNASPVIAEVGICYGTNSVAGDTTNGWESVSLVYPPQKPGSVFSVTSPYLRTNVTYYYRWFATNAYGSSWTAVASFTSSGEYPPGWGLGGGAAVIHVKKTALGDGDGRDWFNAFTTIAGGVAAVSGAKSNIWIASGTYAEGGMIPVGTSLTMIGGFAGTETSLTERAMTNALGVPTNYTTINGENAYKCLGITSGNVWLDTLVFSNASLSQAVNKSGNGALTMNNCRIVGNTASGLNGTGTGVGGYFTGGTVLMTNCLVANNIQYGYANYGFGIYSSGAYLQLVDCLFSNNWGNAWDARSGRGGGLAFDNGTLVVMRTDFIGNGRPGHDGGGGAVYLGNSATMSATFNKCVFRGNQSGNTNEMVAGTGSSFGNPGFGGAIWMNLNGLAKTCTVVNCTFKDSLNDYGNGGAIYVSGGTLVLKDSIFWANGVRNGFSGSEIYAINAASRVINSYSCFSGTNAPYVVAASSASIQYGLGIITNDPLFASATDVHLKSRGGRYNPATGMFVTSDTVVSPCIDAGDPESAFANEPMPNGNRVNLGAYGNTAQASKTYRPAGTLIIVW